MAVKVKINIDPNAILRNRHLEDGGAAQKFLASEVLRFSDPYTPLDTSMLKSNVSITNDGKQIIYHSPYSIYQYYGKAMAGNPRKATDKDLVYDGSPMRGAFWIKRMWADRKEDIEKAVADFVGGRAK